MRWRLALSPWSTPHATDVAQDGRGQNHILLVPTLERVADQAGDEPDKVGFFGEIVQWVAPVSDLWWRSS